jgi:hypothetical protein
MRKWIVAIAAVALLGGCVKMDKTPPSDLPGYARLYPGGQPMMKMAMGPLAAEVETTTDKPDAVIAWYRSQAASDGLSEKANAAQSTTGQQQATFADASGSKLLVISAKAQDDGSLISIGYRPAAKAAS